MEAQQESLDEVYQRAVDARSVGNPTDLLRAALELRSIAEARHDDEMTAWAHYFHTTSLLWMSRFTESSAVGNEALTFVEAFGTPACRIGLHGSLAFTRLELLDAPGGLRHATAALNVARSHVTTLGRVPISKCLNAMAVSLEQLGDITRGIELLEEAEAALAGEEGFEAATARFSAAINLTILHRHRAERARDEGDVNTATAMAELALADVDKAAAIQSGMAMQTWQCAEQRAALGTLAGQPALSLEALQELRSLADPDSGTPKVVAIYEARALVALGRVDEACDLDKRHLTSFESGDQDLNYAEWLLTRLAVMTASGDFEAALAISRTLRVHQNQTSRRRTQAHVQALIHDAEIQRANSQSDRLRTAVEQTRSRADAAVQASLRDPLTGIANRRALDESLTAWTNTTPRETLALAFVDVDRFKSVNDTYGHDVGDAVLCAITELLADCVRSDDLVARYGGEEFVVLLLGCTLDLAFDICDRIHHAVSGHDWTATFGHPRQVTASIGLTLAAADDDAETIVKRADRAMYRAKQAGRNRIIVDAPVQVGH